MTKEQEKFLRMMELQGKERSESSSAGNAEESREYAALCNVGTKELPVVGLSLWQENFSSDISYGFSTRFGGESRGIYESLNLGLHLSDEEQDVRENYRRLCKVLQMPMERICCPWQMHHTNINVVKTTDAGNGITRPREYEDIDGQITNVPNLPLICYGADCVPLLFFDPEKKVIGTAHAGWRGTVDEIAAKMVSVLHENYGSRPENIQVAIGPSAGPKEYEVSREVLMEAEETLARIEMFTRNGGGKDSDAESGQNALTQNVLVPTDPEHGLLNLWELNRQVLLSAGVLLEHILITGLSTLAYPECFFSHRRSGGQRGLQCGIIMLK